MDDLVHGKIDSISFTKDSPYRYLFARRLGSSIAVTYKEEAKIIEFSLPVEEAERTLTA